MNLAVSLSRTALANGLLASPLVSPRLRGRLLRRLGFAVPTSTHVEPGVEVVVRQHLAVGPRSRIGSGVLIENWAPIRLGADVAIASRARLTTGAHRIEGPDRRWGLLTPEPITIEDGTWIGAGVTVLPGVTIGAGCIVGAGAVVADDCQPNGLYLGVPARRVRDLDADARETRLHPPAVPEAVPA